MKFDMKIVMPSTGHKNNTAQPKKVSYFASHFIFHRFVVVVVVFTV